MSEGVPTGSRLATCLGGIDIYLLDQLLRGRIVSGMTLFDAGCGDGRNLRYFLAAGYEVMGADCEAAAIDGVRALAARLAPRAPAADFRCESLEKLSFDEDSADVVICNAVLHLAHNDEQFWTMLNGCWRLLRPGGLFFSRLASTIGMEGRFRSIDGRWHALPDGTERYLVDERFLLEATEQLGGQLLDPIKTTVVQDMRCMTTWVVRKHPFGGRP